MKATKEFVKSCYSEDLLASGGSVDEKQETQFVIEDNESGNMSVASGGAQETTRYHGGLGLKFKFPGDPKK